MNGLLEPLLSGTVRDCLDSLKRLMPYLSHMESERGKARPVVGSDRPTMASFLQHFLWPQEGRMLWFSQQCVCVCRGVYWGEVTVWGRARRSSLCLMKGHSSGGMHTEHKDGEGAGERPQQHPFWRALESRESFPYWSAGFLFKTGRWTRSPL